MATQKCIKTVQLYKTSPAWPTQLTYIPVCMALLGC